MHPRALNNTLNVHDIKLMRLPLPVADIVRVLSDWLFFGFYFYNLSCIFEISHHFSKP